MPLFVDRSILRCTNNALKRGALLCDRHILQRVSGIMEAPHLAHNRAITAKSLNFDLFGSALNAYQAELYEQFSSG